MKNNEHKTLKNRWPPKLSCLPFDSILCETIPYAIFRTSLTVELIYFLCLVVHLLDSSYFSLLSHDLLFGSILSLFPQLFSTYTDSLDVNLSSSTFPSIFFGPRSVCFSSWYFILLGKVALWAKRRQVECLIHHEIRQKRTEGRYHGQSLCSSVCTRSLRGWVK